MTEIARQAWMKLGLFVLSGALLTGMIAMMTDGGASNAGPMTRTQKAQTEAAAKAPLAKTTETGKARHSMEIQTVISPGGIKAWLVESHIVPLISMRFAFTGGASQDPAGKEGVSYFLSGMFDEGAGDLKSTAFQQRMDELAIKMSYDTGRDTFTGNFQTLTKNREEAFNLLRLALTETRFDKDALERVREQILTGLKFDAKNPGKVASRQWFKLAFGDHPYGRSVQGTEKSVAALSAADLRAYKRRVLARDNLTIAVVGDIDAKTLGPLLDKVFGPLPEKAELAKIPDMAPAPGPVRKLVEMNVPQSVVQFGHAGIKRKDKDFIPAYIVNYILGGGGFSSRLMEEVREKRGLAYSVYSYLSPYQHSAVFLGGVATKNTAVEKSIEVIKTELARMAEHGPTAQELDNAKKYLTGSYPLRFDTSSKIANQLLWLQIENLGKDYVKNRNSMIEAVSLEEIRRVARRLLKPGNLIITIVGKPKKAPS